jgi:hypothetical protein
MVIEARKTHNIIKVEEWLSEGKKLAPGPSPKYHHGKLLRSSTEISVVLPVTFSRIWRG